MEQTVYETDFSELNLVKRGKVRDIYDLGDALLIVATDRLSAFDVIMPEPIPDKGKVLTGISLFWFDLLRPLVPNHVITHDVDGYPAPCNLYAEILRGRSMIVKKAEPLPIECVVRGYISGSGWTSYKESGSICGIKLPENLHESDRLDTPIFTPSTKEELGYHDINIDFEEVVRRIGRDRAESVKRLSLAIFEKGARKADQQGLILADTKFEFGMVDNEIILIDEVLTPDSSRFWPKASYRPGGPQESFDKQYVRDYLISINWEKKPPAPSLPEEIVRNTRNKYLEAFTKLTGTGYAL